MPPLGFVLVQLVAAALVGAILVAVHQGLKSRDRLLAWLGCVAAYVAFELFYWATVRSDPKSFSLILGWILTPTLAFGIIWWTSKLRASTKLQWFVATVAGWLVSYPLGIVYYTS